MSADKYECFKEVLSDLLTRWKVDERAMTKTKSKEVFDNIPTEAMLLLLNSIITRTLPNFEKHTAYLLLKHLMRIDFSRLYALLSAESQDQLKKSLILLVQAETDEEFKEILSDIISELAKNLIDDDGNCHWPELLQFLSGCLISTSPQMTEYGLRIFANIPGILRNQQNIDWNLIEQTLQQSLMDVSNRKLRAQAVRAVCSLIILRKTERTIQEHFQDLLPNIIIQVLEENFQNKTDYSVIKSFLKLLESCPEFLRPHIGGFIELCFKVSTDKETDDEIRYLVLYVILKLCQADSATMKKDHTYVGRLVESILKLMASVEEDPEWRCFDKMSDDRNEINSFAGGSLIMKLIDALGAEVVLPHVINNTSAMLLNADWRYRHAALFGIGIVMEQCHNQIEPFLPQFIGNVVHFLTDEHARVKYTTCYALCEIAVEFASTLQEKFHKRIVPSLLHLMDEHSDPKLQSIASTALICFLKNCPTSILVLYSKEILMKLEVILNVKSTELHKNGTEKVLGSVIVAIEIVSDAVGEQFVEFLDRFIPKLKEIIDDTDTPELRLLRVKCLKCVRIMESVIEKVKRKSKNSGWCSLKSSIFFADSEKNKQN